MAVSIEVYDDVFFIVKEKLLSTKKLLNGYEMVIFSIISFLKLLIYYDIGHIYFCGIHENNIIRVTYKITN